MPPPPLPEFWRKAPHDDKITTLSSSTSSEVPVPLVKTQTSLKLKERGKTQQTAFQQTKPSAPPLQNTTHHITFAPLPASTPRISLNGPSDPDMRHHTLSRPIFTIQPHASDDPPPLAVYHICRICFRPRSARYHREHPIPLNGFPPPPGICRRCRVTSVEDTEKVDTVVQSESQDVRLGLRCLVPDDSYVSAEEMQEVRGRKILKTLNDGNRLVREDKETKRTRKDSPTKREKNATYRYVMVRHKSASRTRPAAVPKGKVAATSQEAIEASLSNKKHNVPPRKTATVAARTEVKAQADIKPTSKTDTSRKSSPNSHEISQAKSSVLISSEAQSRIKIDDPRHSNLPKSASRTTHSVAQVKVTAQPTESEIRRIAREEIEYYRQAERKIEAHRSAFAHGRMIPVERRISQASDRPTAVPWKEASKESAVAIEREHEYVATLPNHFGSRVCDVSTKEREHVVNAARNVNTARSSAQTQTSPRVAAPENRKYQAKVSYEHDQDEGRQSSHNRSQHDHQQSPVEMSGALPSSSISTGSSRTEIRMSTKTSKFNQSDARKVSSSTFSSGHNWSPRELQERRSARQESSTYDVNAEQATNPDEWKSSRKPPKDRPREEKLHNVMDPRVCTQDQVRVLNKHSAHLPDTDTGEKASKASMLMSKPHRGSKTEYGHKERPNEASTAQRNRALSACPKTTTDKLHLDEDIVPRNTGNRKTSAMRQTDEDEAASARKSGSRQGDHAEAKYITGSRWQGRHSGRQKDEQYTSIPSSQHNQQDIRRNLSPQATEAQSTISNTKRSHVSHASTAPSKHSNLRSDSGYMGGDSEYMYTVRTVTPVNRPLSERELDQVLGYEYQKTEEYVRRRKLKEFKRAHEDSQSYAGRRIMPDSWIEAPASNAPSQGTNITAKSRVSEAGTVGTDGTRSVRFAKKVDFSPTPPNSEASSSQFRMIGGRECRSAIMQLGSAEYHNERGQNLDLTTEDLHRGRSRSRGMTVENNPGVYDQFVLVDEMEYIPQSNRDLHDPRDSTHHGSKEPSLMHALSESPSRERLDEMFKTGDQHDSRLTSPGFAGPYRAPGPMNPRPASVDADDGSNAPTSWNRVDNETRGNVVGVDW
nr:hypothetical protein CFP56_10141 [Quercus suber]